MLYEKQKFYQSHWDCSYGDRIWSKYLTDWVNEKKMDEKIEEKVNEALAKKDDENEEES